MPAPRHTPGARLARPAAALLLLLAPALPAQSRGRVLPARDSAATGVRVCAGGDVTVGTNLDTTWVRMAARRLRTRVRALPNPDSLLAPLRPLVRDADVVLVNVEGAIGTGAVEKPKCRKGSTQCFAFRQPPATARALRRLGGDHAAVIGNVANNHSGDAGPDGLRETMRRLEGAGVQVTGADTLATVVVTPAGDTVAFLGFSTSAGPDPRDLDAVRRHVERAAARWPRLVVTMHMGAEGANAQRTRDTTEMFLGIDRGNPVKFAHAAAEAGADLVVGHGPHVVRALEWQGGTLVAYSLGNLVTYGPFTLRDPLNRGGLLCATLGPDGEVLGATLRSTRQRPPGLVAADLGGTAAALADSLSRLDFPRTGARLIPEAVVLRPDGRRP
ncbi:MAG TPA: CapA family protein [Gemmatimonadaceae bacterium]|nr:CapA family protein [Gemmatimonadaceae bacterium]